MQLYWAPWNFTASRGIPWVFTNLFMEIVQIRVEFPWTRKTMEFRGHQCGAPGFHGVPWDPVEYSTAGYPRKSMGLPRHSIDNHMDFHEVPWSFHGIAK